MRRQYSPPPVDEVISALAARQHGVVARWQLIDHGVDEHAIDRRLRGGRLHRIHPAVYAVGHATLTAEGRWLAAVLACRHGAVLSHRAAAALWGLRPAWRDMLEVSVRSARRVPGVIVHRPRTLLDADRTVKDAVPVTSVSRTLTDLADVVEQRVLARVLEQAEVLRLDAAPQPIPGRRGTGRLIRALAARGPHVGLTRSELEIRFLELCRTAGLPAPLVNTTVEGMEVDFCWPRARVIVETDGWAYHGTRTAFSRDRRRSATLSLHGWTVVRFTYEDVVHDPGYVQDTLRGLLD